MSAPLKLTTAQLHTIATVLEELTKITTEYGVDFAPRGPITIGIGDNTLSVSRDSDAYVIDDRNGH